MINPILHKKEQKLIHILQALSQGGLVVCFSGGVDSTLLAAIAHEAGCSPLLALTFVTPTVPRRDVTEAVSIGRELGLPHQILELNTLSIPEVLNNDRRRCYFCKKALYQAAADLAASQGYAHLADGCNLDDMSPEIYRPGNQAADEIGVAHPLVEAGFTKDDIRVLSQELGLRNHARPASPCLVSRFPYDTQLTTEGLRLAEEGESALRELGLKEFRLRCHDDLARIELSAEEEPLLLEQREKVITMLRRLGYRYICLDLAGLVSGGFDQEVPGEEQA